MFQKFTPPVRSSEGNVTILAELCLYSVLKLCFLPSLLSICGVDLTCNVTKGTWLHDHIDKLIDKQSGIM